MATVVEISLLVALLAMSYRAAPLLSTLTRLPTITVLLLAGIACRVGLLGVHVAHTVLPLHQATLAMITFAAGSELDVVALRKNARVVLTLTCCLTAAALFCVFTLGLALPTLVYQYEQPADDAGGEDQPGDGGDVQRWRRTWVASMLAAVVAIARSPSSAIGVVTELQADGPFTQVMLTITMVTDVVVIVLFTAVVELAEPLLSPSSHGAPLGRVVFRFVLRSTIHLALSALHAAALIILCLFALRIPRHGRISLLRPLALLCVGGFAFGTERLLHTLLHGHALDDFVRLEPMLSCILAGFVLCNWCGVRRAFGDVLRRAMPATLTFFFFTTGMSINLHALAHSWPAACGLFAARLLSIRAGYALGAHLAPASSYFDVKASTAWLALITQAGVGLGLAEEIGERFAPWAEGLRTNIVATIVLNQILGPPLLRHALRTSGEAGRLIPRDRLVEQLTRRLMVSNPKAVAAIAAAGRVASGLSTRQ